MSGHLISPRRRSGAGRGATTITERLRGWWSGGEPRATAAPVPAPPEESEDNEDSAPAPYWSPEVLEIASRVWGPDHLGPTDEDYIRYVLKPLGIKPDLSVLEIGSGLGGGARAIARDYDAWVIGLETDPILAEAGMTLSVRSGMAKKAPIRHFDPRKSLKNRQFDRILIRNTLGCFPDKEHFLETVRETMKDKAQLFISDFVLAERGASDARVQAWMEGEPSPVEPVTAGKLLKTLKTLNVSVHVAEDESAKIASIVTTRWDRIRTHLKPSSLRPELVEPMLREGARWQRCMEALDSGGLRYYRVVASV